jgi:endonuclease III
MPVEADSNDVARRLAQAYPDARCELYARDPWELLVAVILSARTTDQQVNKVMAVLTEHLIGVDAYARLDPRRLARLISRLPLYPQKARSIVEAARRIVAVYGGQVPATLRDLTSLPGVGPKTAAVVAGNLYGIPAVAADVHVQRIVRRLGWTKREHAREAERAVMDRLPPHHWVPLSHQMIRLGRDCCRPRQPRCERCPLAATCPREGIAIPL